MEKWDSVEDFVKAHCGNVVIKKVLIANNGLAAVKFIKSIHIWALCTFGNERAIQIVVMATPEDIKANAEFIRMADLFVPVPSGSNNNNYANVNLILDIAQRTNAQAVWAGWGHASENPFLPDTLHAHGITFIGPPGYAMRALGDKISSSIVAQSANVPTLPWNGSDITEVEKIEDKGKPLLKVSESVYKNATILTLEEGLSACTKVGFPVMIKASEGGGGKGIRKAKNINEFPLLFRQVQGEVPGSPIFIMQLAENARHLEVQIVADAYGNTISLFSRDCSVQRRHQKVIEEAPVTVAPKEVIEEMEKAAVRLTKLVGYISVGTVEFLYSEGKFYFLELNPRLQVEHPCTEMISDVNIPATQLLIAMGVPLYCIKDIRTLYNLNPLEKSVINFDESRHIPKTKGHVIAARITAENPDDGFTPNNGTLEELNFRTLKDVWGYFSVPSRGSLHEYADSQFGHVFAWGTSREQAKNNLVLALKQLSVRGNFRNTTEMLLKICLSEDFRNNTFHTGWLDTLISQKVCPERPDPMVAVICAAVHVSKNKIQKILDEFANALEKGHNIELRHQFDGEINLELIHESKKYTMTASQSGPNTLIFEMNSSYIEVEMHQLSDGACLVIFGERSYVTYMHEEIDKYRLLVNGKTAVFQKENDPTVLRSISPGKLVRYLTDDGAHLDAGSQYAEIEVMKMYMTLCTTESGSIHHSKQVGASIEIGEVLATMSLDDPSKKSEVEVFTGLFPNFDSNIHGQKVHQLLKTSLVFFQNVLDGYWCPESIFSEKLKIHVERLQNVLIDPSLPLHEIQDILSSLSGRIDASLESQIVKYLDTYKKSLGSLFTNFPTNEIKEAIPKYASSITDKHELEKFNNTIIPVLELVSKYQNGVRAHGGLVVVSLLNQYYKVEEEFNKGRAETQVMASLREKYKSEPEKLTQLIIAHSNDSNRSAAVCYLLDYLSTFTSMTQEEISIIGQLASLRIPRNAKVGLKARKILLWADMPSFEHRRLDMEVSLQKLVDAVEEPSQKLKEMVRNASTHFDVLTTFFYHIRHVIRTASLEIYVRRAYNAHNITQISHHQYNKNIPFVLFQYESPDNSEKTAKGIMVALHNLDDLSQCLEVISQSLEEPPSSEECSITVALKEQSSFQIGHTDNDSIKSKELYQYLKNHIVEINGSVIKRITFVILHLQKSPNYFTFREELGWKEDEIYRHIEPGLAYQLELNRLSNYNIKFCPTDNNRLQIYFAESKTPGVDRRFFARSIVHHPDLGTEDASLDYWVYEAEKVIIEGLSALELLRSDPKYGMTDGNHIFINFFPTVTLDNKIIYESIIKLLIKHGERFYKLRVTEGEIITNTRNPKTGEVTRLRWFVRNDRGFMNNDTIRYYEEKTTEDGKKILSPIELDLIRGVPNQWHEEDISKPYEIGGKLQKKRYLAQSQGTSYVYDIPPMFSKAVARYWRQLSKLNKYQNIPEVKVKAIEYRLQYIDDKQYELVEIPQGEQGTSPIGMIAWKMTLFTPEYPEGRDIIVIANDITQYYGSFAPEEDKVFLRASELARKLGIPRIYVAVNSGARIELAQEVKRAFKISWKNGDPTKGLNYLYLSPDDYEKLNSTKPAVIAEKIEEDNEIRYKLIDIIGHEEGLGVENLQGSGMIAGESSLAYDEICTFALVTCRTVGIGAYLVRLSQRVIQVDSAPIILTGAPALNKVLGRSVYLSNEQIGGPQIMYTNGVTHLSVNSDLAGIEAIVNWLSYLPKTKLSSLPLLDTEDPVDRLIDYTPTSTPYDPRWMITGRRSSNGWESGFFDKESWMETLGGWAKNVVCGRARLGGIPVGVIVVETRTIETEIPADPAEINSVNQTVQQAGQVWFPNSTYKTAQAIQDFNKEKLPLIIFANWRGFSGGMRDMFFEIIKFGALIVDNLRKYEQPVFVYIPPYGELRGGAWVVLDPTINSDMIEMYADENSRGGVLEPEGTVEIKYRERDLIQTMERLDEEYASIQNKLNDTTISNEEKSLLRNQLAARRKLLLPIYRQVAVHFADLHDTPGRMKAKNVIRDKLIWKHARKYFALRLKRRIDEEKVITQIKNADRSVTHVQALRHLREWFTAKNGDETWDDDKIVSEWISSNSPDIEKLVEEKILHPYILSNIDLATKNKTLAMETVLKLINSLNEEQRKQLKEKL